MYRRGQGWSGIICCFVLFILIFLSLSLLVPAPFIETAHPELGMLLFVLPGAVASFVAKEDKVVGPLVGALVALPFCLLMAHTLLPPARSFWQEVAWLSSAVFWTSLGTLSFLLLKLLCKRFLKIKKPTR